MQFTKHFHIFYFIDFHASPGNCLSFFSVGAFRIHSSVVTAWSLSSPLTAPPIKSILTNYWRISPFWPQPSLLPAFMFYAHWSHSFTSSPNHHFFFSFNLNWFQKGREKGEEREKCSLSVPQTLQGSLTLGTLPFSATWACAPMGNRTRTSWS